MRQAMDSATSTTCEPAMLLFVRMVADATELIQAVVGEGHGRFGAGFGGGDTLTDQTKVILGLLGACIGQLQTTSLDRHRELRAAFGEKAIRVPCGCGKPLHQILVVTVGGLRSSDLQADEDVLGQAGKLVTHLFGELTQKRIVLDSLRHQEDQIGHRQMHFGVDEVHLGLLAHIAEQRFETASDAIDTRELMMSH